MLPCLLFALSLSLYIYTCNRKHICITKTHIRICIFLDGIEFYTCIVEIVTLTAFPGPFIWKNSICVLLVVCSVFFWVCVTLPGPDNNMCMVLACPCLALDAQTFQAYHRSLGIGHLNRLHHSPDTNPLWPVVFNITILSYSTYSGFVCIAAVMQVAQHDLWQNKVLKVINSRIRHFKHVVSKPWTWHAQGMIPPMLTTSWIIMDSTPWICKGLKTLIFTVPDTMVIAEWNFILIGRPCIKETKLNK